MSFISDPQPFHRFRIAPAVPLPAVSPIRRLKVPPATWPPPNDSCWEIIGLPRQELVALYNELDGFLMFPGLQLYQDARSADQAHFATPRVIAICTTADDVKKSLAWARAHDWLLSTRSGGHNGAGFHLCNGITLDLQNLNTVRMDAANNQVTVGAGARWADVGACLNGQGGCLPGGTCGHVAVSGFTQGGGYSFLSRVTGLTCDLLVSAQVLLTNGEVVTASGREHSDLFWALRGGGGGQFGIVLSMTFNLVTPDAFFGFVLNWPLEDAPRVLEYIEAHHTSNTTRPDRLGYLVAVTPLAREGDPNSAEDEPSLSFLGMFRGTENEARQHVKDLSCLGRAKWRWSESGTFYRLNDAIFEVLPYTALGLKQAKKMEITGYVDAERSPDWEGLAQHILESPHPGNLIAFEPYGGAIAAVPSDETAFPHRHHKLNMKVNSYWVPGSETRTRPAAERWLHGAGAILEPSLNGSVYVNYMREDVVDYRTAYWGTSFNRLLAVKQQYDPDMVFRFEQSIRPR